MSAVVHPMSTPDPQPLLAKLIEAVRPEFQSELIHIDVDDPVFSRGRCDVGDCPRAILARRLCGAHLQRWNHHRRPDLAEFIATTGPIKNRAGSELVDTFDLRRLAGRDQLRLELAYSVQCRHDDRTVRLLPEMIRHCVALLAESMVGSLLDRPPQWWVDRAVRTGRIGSGSRTVGQLRYAWRRLDDLAHDANAESEFTRDTWRAAVLGLDVARPPRSVSFAQITHPWLRDAVKRHARFRLASGKAFGTIYIDVRAVRYFSVFLTERHPEVVHPSGISRAVIEHYISWLATSQLAGYPMNTYLVTLRGFLDACRRHGWLAGLPTAATVYLDELPPRPRPLPRFIDEFVMAQLENPEHLALLPDDTTRHLLLVIMETGLRITDACRLPFNPIIDDSVGWPCLQFFNTKMKCEQLVPLSQAAAVAIRSQQAHLRQRWDDPPPRLFPSPHCNPDGTRPFSDATFRSRLNAWQHTIDLRDEAGQRVQVSPHRFRHTLGTRLINAGVPQHVVQKMLGHASPQMTARYATIHDSTVRAAFDDYQRRRVDTQGARLEFDPGAPAAEAEWVKHNLARVAASLPNGYCARPPQQDCPHPNACLTCPDFQTTPQFLPLHRRQRDDTLVLVTAAEQAGNTRLATNHRQVVDNLENVIDALETIEQEATDAS